MSSLRLCLLSALLLVSAVFCQAADPAPAKPAAPVVILDTAGFWRLYHVMKPPVAALDGGLKPALTGLKWLDEETPAPPADWMSPDFDGSSWGRLPLRRSAATPYLGAVYVRGKFRVTDAAKVKGLKLWVDFYGGAVAYVNGKELAREKLVAGAAMADAYPEEAFADVDGKMLNYRDRGTGETLKRKESRTRKLEAVAVPASFLRTGVNVLAIQIVGSPLNKVVANFKPMNPDAAKHPYDLPWGTCQVLRVRLAADAPDGLIPNCVRPAEMQVWNSDLLAADFDMDYGDNCEELRPVHMIGGRNGAYSGKVVVGSSKSIVGLKATPSELKGEGGSIPASAIQVRYGLPWGEETPAIDSWCSLGYPYTNQATLLGALWDAPPREANVRVKPVAGAYFAAPNQPSAVFGAVVSVWATVKVPAAAKPGLYKGQFLIEAQGEKPVAVPLEVQVMGWTLPDPKDLRTWVEFIESPETLTLEYGLEPWSEKHWSMIARSFRLFSQTSSRVVYAPLIAHCNNGNEYSMVRWVPKADGTFDYDLSILDKYLDVAVQNMGQPKIVCFPVWDIYLLRKEIESPTGVDTKAAVAARKALAGKGPLVTREDPATKKLENFNLPQFTDASSKALWQPLFDQLRAHLKAKGLEGAAALGFLSDAQPTKEEYQFLYEVSGGMPWVSHSHHGTQAQPPAKTAYYTHVFSADYPHETSKLGWLKAEGLRVLNRRGDLNGFSALTWRTFPEISITAIEKGIGRLGGDYWNAVKDKGGRRITNVANIYPESSWRNIELITYSLAPGPEGPVATNRFEAVREGLQDAEARIYLESALVDKAKREKVGEELAGRIQKTLDERIRNTWRGNSGFQITYAHYAWGYPTPLGAGMSSGQAWFLNSRWQDRSERLYSLAAEVEKKLAHQ